MGSNRHAVTLIAGTVIAGDVFHGPGLSSSLVSTSLRAAPGNRRRSSRSSAVGSRSGWAKRVARASMPPAWRSQLPKVGCLTKSTWSQFEPDKVRERLSAGPPVARRRRRGASGRRTAGARKPQHRPRHQPSPQRGAKAWSRGAPAQPSAPGVLLLERLQSWHGRLDRLRVLNVNTLRRLDPVLIDLDSARVGLEGTFDLDRSHGNVGEQTLMSGLAASDVDQDVGVREV